MMILIFENTSLRTVTAWYGEDKDGNDIVRITTSELVSFRAEESEELGIHFRVNGKLFQVKTEYVFDLSPYNGFLYEDGKEVAISNVYPA